ncbi:MAG: hypothetical protein FWC56_03390, partial [Phycisphaerae bacterium]|nr:hypothetical protein [Phycisphaerae bacterium]
MTNGAEQNEALRSVCRRRRSLRELERAALNAYLDLCTGVADVQDSRLTQQHTTARARRNEGYQKLLSQLDQQHRDAQAKAADELQTFVRSVREQYDNQMAAIEAEYIKRRDNVTDEAETTLREGRQSTEQEVWLAESVCEASREQVRHDRKTFEKNAPELTNRLDQIDERLAWLLTRYAYSPATANESATTRKSPVASTESRGVSAESVNDLYEEALSQLDALDSLRSPQWAIGPGPFLLGSLLCAVLIGAAGGISAIIGTGLYGFAWMAPIALIVG